MGSLLAGGAFTLIAIPVVVVALAAGAFLRALARRTARLGAAGEDSGRGVTTPADLADARRAEQ
ncbi:MAG TPA: hypothetical protein VG275_08760 [Solirubrobacteraceae bacterium]|nr:hypothetical protein [Solirubrobacteraceae bacterium]